MSVKMDFPEKDGDKIRVVTFFVNLEPQYGDVWVRIENSEADLSRDVDGKIVKRTELLSLAKTKYLDRIAEIDVERSESETKETERIKEIKDSAVNPTDSDFK